MIIKRYMASTTQEAIAQVKMDLGSDAIILNTRRIRKKGIRAWFSKPLMEVTAAIDEDITRPTLYKGVNNREDKGTIEENRSLKEIEQKVTAMGKMVEKIMADYSTKSPTVSKDKPETDNLGKNRVYYDILMENEVRQEYIEDIIKKVGQLNIEQGMEFPLCFESVILECLGNIAKPIEVDPLKRKVILFVGPTGVGKTTTLAKLAAGFAIDQDKKVGFITADTYRIAAVDQLKVYAEILEIPMSIIYSPSEITEALEEHSDRDIIFIDTPGRSIRDEDHEKEISEIIKRGAIDEIYLVVSGSTSPKGCVNIINSYSFLPDYKLIFTKIDEITSYGSIINCCLLSGKPLSYITTGQNVPADIEVASSNRIKDLLVGNAEI